jgi:hypothetical protein
MAEAETVATQARTLPATGKWSEAHLLDRLVRAGVAPRLLADSLWRGLPEAPWMGARPLAIAAGGGLVLAWIFPDSSARRAVTDALDAETGTPPGRVVPFESPMVFVLQNNLAAVITGGTVTAQERIMLALQAGLPRGEGTP